MARLKKRKKKKGNRFQTRVCLKPDSSCHLEAETSKLTHLMRLLCGSNIYIRHEITFKSFQQIEMPFNIL